MVEKGNWDEAVGVRVFLSESQICEITKMALIVGCLVLKKVYTFEKKSLLWFKNSDCGRQVAGKAD